MDLSRFYEADHLIDEHLDMWLDIDSMTYEVQRRMPTHGTVSFFQTLLWVYM
jgi:hypothetical protein